MANMRTDKVRAFLSSLPPGQIKLTLARSDKVLGSQESRDRSVVHAHVLISPTLPILQYLLVSICALNL